MITLLITSMILLTILSILLYIVDAAAIPTFIVFLVLKLTNVITWSWLIVCLPLIILAASIVLTFIVGIVTSMLKEFTE